MDSQGGRIENSFIIGNSKAPDTWLKLLERGLKFIPTPNAWDHHKWTSEVDTILDKIINHIWFSDKQSSRTNNDLEAVRVTEPLVSTPDEAMNVSPLAPAADPAPEEEILYDHNCQG